MYGKMKNHNMTSSIGCCELVRELAGHSCCHRPGATPTQPELVPILSRRMPVRDAGAYDPSREH